MVAVVGLTGRLLNPEVRERLRRLYSEREPPSTGVAAQSCSSPGPRGKLSTCR